MIEERLVLDPQLGRGYRLGCVVRIVVSGAGTRKGQARYRYHQDAAPRAMPALRHRSPHSTSDLHGLSREAGSRRS
jgi:hypothetical protein